MPHISISISITNSELTTTLQIGCMMLETLQDIQINSYLNIKCCYEMCFDLRYKIEAL